MARVAVLQFHVECTEQIARNLCHECRHELSALPPEDAFEPFKGQLLSALKQQNQLGRDMILRWADLFD